MLRNRLEDDEFSSSDDEIIGPSSPVDPKPTAPTTESNPPPTQAPLTTEPDPVPLQPPSPDAIQHTTSAPSPRVRIPSTTARPALHIRGSTSGLSRFKAAGHAVMQARALSQGDVGAEPGIDVRKSSAAMLYGHIHEKCDIEIVDYNDTQAVFKRCDNDSFRTWIDSPASRRKPSMQVRWINVGGLSWDVVSELGLKYDLHPLALEDVLNNRKLARSKADYYSKHLFLRIICHQLLDGDDANSVLFDSPRSSSPSRIDSSTVSSRSTRVSEDGYASEKGQDGELGLRGRFMKKKTFDAENHAANPHTQRRSRLATMMMSSAQRHRVAERVSLEELKRGDRVNVALKTMFVFLGRDGTVISIHNSPLRFTAPIALRLKAPETNLRTSGDPSMLVHALLDLAVDKALEIIEAYHDRIQTLEHETLLKNKLKTVRALHILSGDLILHKRTMEPIKQLVYGLRRYDLARATALANDNPNAEVKGFMSHKAKVYLADVVDHVEHIMSSLDMFSAIAENLMSYTFNVNSSQTNEIMRRFTIVTIICLPLTLLTGYFGMNFVRFDAVMLHSDVFFWEIAIPVLAVVVVVTLWSDFHRMVHHVKKRFFYQKVTRRLQ